MLKASLRDSRARPVEDLFLGAKQVMLSSAVRPHIPWSSPDLTPLTGLSDLDSLALAYPVLSFPVPALAFAERWLPGHKHILVGSPHLALHYIPGRGFCLESWGRGIYEGPRKGGSILRTECVGGTLDSKCEYSAAIPRESWTPRQNCT